MASESMAINRSPEDVAKQFQEYLREHENDDRLVILKAVDKPGSKLGDNYMSVMLRTELIGTRGNGSPYNKIYMTKLFFPRPASGFVNLPDLFRIEAHVYNKILPILGKAFGPQCIYADEKNIIMEDLAVKKYVNCDRHNFLDMEHTIYALKKLAQLHASALALKINNRELFNEIIESLEEVIYKDSNQVQKPGTESCIEATATHLRMVEPQTPELKKVADYISDHVGKCYDKLYKMFNGPKQKYDTICHGDPWNNNLLFLHDDSGNIVDLKMVDYQICRYTSVSTDILYLIYASVHSSLIENSYETLIEVYHDELIKNLRRKSISEEILAELGMDWLQAELKKYSLYGMLIGCILVHPMLADEADAERFENVKVQDTDDFINNLVKIGVTQKKLDRIRCVALHYYRKYVCER